MGWWTSKASPVITLNAVVLLVGNRHHMKQDPPPFPRARRCNLK